MLCIFDSEQGAPIILRKMVLKVRISCDYTIKALPTIQWYRLCHRGHRVG